MTEKNHERIGDFEIIRELGRGGMGIVYEARQISLGRQVALKVLSSGLGMTTRAVERFRREASAAARLHHTNIVPVYTTGEEQGTHYYAMELIDGPSLDVVIKRLQAEEKGATLEALNRSTLSYDAFQAAADATTSPHFVKTPRSSKSLTAASGDSSLPEGNYFDTVATLLAGVADALDYAHSQGMIHRDIKPSNLLLSSDGRLSINDFGLVRMLENPGMTTTGEFIGSPLYMSPEQIAAGRAKLDHRTDIYSLGATFYEILTLQPPFTGLQREQVIGQILTREPRMPRRINGKIPVDLETICMKAMDKDPAGRYQKASEMADDLRRSVKGFAISARRTGVAGRARKWVRRHPLVSAALSIALVSTIAAVLLAFRSHQTEARLRETELIAIQEKAAIHAISGNLDEAERQVRLAERRGASTGWAHILRGQVAAFSGQFEDAVFHGEQAVRLLPDSTAAQGLLTFSVLEAGYEDRYYLIVQDLARMESQGFADHLLRGMGLAWAMPDEALSELDQAVRLRPTSPIARLRRAQLRRYRAMNSGRLDDADHVIEDAEAALSFLSDNPSALFEHLMAHLVRANALKTAKDDRYQDALDVVARDARLLTEFPDNLGARWARAYYYDHIKDLDPLASVCCGEEINAATDQSFMAFRCAILHFEQNRLHQALAACDRASGKEKRIHEYIPAYIRMDMLADHTALLNDYILNQEQRHQDSSGTTQAYDWTVYRLLGAESHAREAAKQYLAAQSKLAFFEHFRERWSATADFLNGTLTAEQLIDICQSNLGGLCEAHFFVGVDYLATGNRKMAAHHFQKSLDTNYFFFFAYYWSRAFLKRLEADPTWPHWIPDQPQVPAD